MALRHRVCSSSTVCAARTTCASAKACAFPRRAAATPPAWRALPTPPSVLATIRSAAAKPFPRSPRAMAPRPPSWPPQRHPQSARIARGSAAAPAGERGQRARRHSARRTSRQAMAKRCPRLRCATRPRPMHCGRSTASMMPTALRIGQRPACAGHRHYACGGARRDLVRHRRPLSATAARSARRQPAARPARLARRADLDHPWRQWSSAPPRIPRRDPLGHCPLTRSAAGAHRGAQCAGGCGQHPTRANCWKSRIEPHGCLNGGRATLNDELTRRLAHGRQATENATP